MQSVTVYYIQQFMTGLFLPFIMGLFLIAIFGGMALLAFRFNQRQEEKYLGHHKQ